MDAALSDRVGDAWFSIPANWISGTLGEVPDAVERKRVRLTTLDTFLEEKGAPPVAFVKCDAEGAEVDVLRGAIRTLSHERAPMWMVEMSSEEAARFGCHPAQVADFFASVPGVTYRACQVNQETGALEPLHVPDAGPFWFNAVFVPPWWEKRLQAHQGRELCDAARVG